ncbi:MAG: S41 family peptidase [Eudoraea sp.]|uniref:S41 family peptidase n=1 Tax=Eudoraea sp. TaxID=1979955 RepID=UPI003263EB73
MNTIRIKSQILCCLFTIFLIVPINTFAQDNELIGRQELIDDARQMLSLLENVHPQPYFAGGGKIAFHQRFQNLLKAIPNNGMTREGFRGLLSPFFALVGDGHTHVYPDSPFNFSGLPLLFYVVEKDLYVAGVIEKEHKNLFGARLLSVEGIQFSEIVRRTQQYYSADNIYGTLAVLGNFEHLLTKRTVLEDIIPEWKDNALINVSFLLPDGNTKKVQFEAKTRPNWELIRPDLNIELPLLEGREFGWGFIGANKDVAYLQVRGMIENRETYEKRATYSDVSEDARVYYKSIYGKETNEPIDKVIAALPSLTETYTDLIVQMKKSGANTLIIDLRTNTGGWAFPSDMLIYFLYGKEALIKLHQQTNIAIRKLSPYYLNDYPDESLDNINNSLINGKPRTFSLTEYDYDFRDYEKMENGKLTSAYAKQIVEDDLALSKTFYNEYTKGTHSNYYIPAKVMVVTNVATFSAGFMFAKSLEIMGATVVGSTSSQNVIQMGETVSYELNNSKLGGSISRSFLVHDTDLLNSPDQKNTLIPHYELTYEKLKEYKFSRHAEILYIQDIISSEN